MTRWFEDLVIDEVFPLGSHTFSAEEIIRFAKLYDPQYFHIDPELAKHSHFGGIIASGWHTVSVGHRKMVDALCAIDKHVREAKPSRKYSRDEVLAMLDEIDPGPHRKGGEAK